MGVDPLTLGVAGATLEGGASVFGALQQNQAINRAMKSTVAASQDALNQLQLKTAAAQQRYVNEARRARGSLRVAAAAGGVRGSDIQALVRQTAFDAEMNTVLAKRDANTRTRAIVSQTDAALTDLSNRAQNPLVQGGLGALQGFLSGYSMGGMFGGEQVAERAADVALAEPIRMGNMQGMYPLL